MAEFQGSFTLSPPLTGRQISAVKKFGEARHGGDSTPWMPELRFWCDWIVTDDGKYLKWNRMEKFYFYVSWLHWLNRMFFTKWQVVMSGRITWEGEDEEDAGVITATPVTREDGISTTEIKPPPGLFDGDIYEILDQEGDNAFLIYPRTSGTLEHLLKEFEESVSASDAIPAGTKWRWKLVARDNQYLEWQGGDELHGCIHWLQQFTKCLLNHDMNGRRHVMLGTVSLPGGLVITAKPMNRNGVCETDIKISSPLLNTGLIDYLSEIDEEDDKQQNCFAVVESRFWFSGAWNDMQEFCSLCHGDKDASEPWIVPDSFYCGWKVRRNPSIIVWEGGDDLQGCVHWLHLLDTQFFRPWKSFMVGKVRLPGGLVIEAEACRKGSVCVTRITPKMPIYDFVREGNTVRLKEVDRTSWKVNWLMSCNGNCGWEVDRPQERPRYNKCPKCGKGVLFTKRMVPPERDDASAVDKRSRNI